jgi:serine/threonine protein kinase
MNTEEMLRLRTESALLWRLKHENIVRIVGLCVGNQPSIVYELVTMGNLKVVLSKKPDWEKKMSILMDIAKGIEYLHNNDIIHRDIKSSNILIDNGYRAKLGDFGFVTLQQDCTMTKCGTPCWIAPEIMQGERYGRSADIYSFGIVMWEVLTCKMPYDGHPNIPEIIKGERPPIPSSCNAGYSALMQACWDSEQEKRPSIEDIIISLSSEDIV